MFIKKFCIILFQWPRKIEGFWFVFIEMASLVQINYTIIESLAGELILYGNRSSLMGLGFMETSNWANRIDQWVEDSATFKEVVVQLNKYFDGTLKEFNIPLSPSGTKFQLGVYRQLIKIPYGETRTYTEIAEEIGNTKAVRAVGNANSKNPIAIIIPCHRVIGRDGSLTGFAGGLEAKKALLKLEENSL